MSYLINCFFYRNEVGTASVEYALLIGLALLAIILGTVGLSDNIQTAFQIVTDAFSN